MLLLLLLCQILPILPLLLRQSLPLLADHLGQIGLTLLLHGSGRALLPLLKRLLAVLAAFAAEKDERVFGTFDVILVPLLRPPLVLTDCRSTTPVRNV